MHAADSAGAAEGRTRRSRPADRNYDLIVIGGGAAGLAAAHAGAATRARTLLVSEGELGGECTFTRCVPFKTLIEAAARGAMFAEAIAAVRKRRWRRSLPPRPPQHLTAAPIRISKPHAPLTPPPAAAAAARPANLC